MNRSELVHAVAQRSGVPDGTADAVLTALADTLADAVQRGDDVRWAGVLTLEAVQRAGRTGRNPATGEPLEIPARRAVKLSAGSRLKAAVSA